MSRFSTEPPELEAMLEDYLDKVVCCRCDDSMMVPEGTLPTAWGIRDRQPMCETCLEREDQSEARYDVERED